VTTSLDGRYQNTWSTFLRWVTASQYGAFLTGDPFGLQRDAAFYRNLFRSQFGWTGIGLGLVGLLALVQRPRRLALTILALAANLAFALSYRAADVEVFFTPAFLIWALLVATGLGALVEICSKIVGQTTPRSASPLSTLCCILVVTACLGEPLILAGANMHTLDRSSDWSVEDYGRDVLSQPLPEGAVVVGLLGEMTLLRYFQRTESLRPDVLTVAADTEEDRHSAVGEAMASEAPTYITRPLAGAPERYSLSAVGPLVRVWPKGQAQLPEPQRQVNLPLTDSVAIVGLSTQVLTSHSGAFIRVSLHWQASAPVTDDLKVSARLLDASGQAIAATDQVPVHTTYPTWAWQPDEIVADGYDLAVPSDAVPGIFRVIAILYRAVDGSELSRVTLGDVTVP
jgi:hypothetical protein